MRYYLRSIFEPFCTCIEAKDGQEALDLAIASRPQLIISDVVRTAACTSYTCLIFADDAQDERYGVTSSDQSQRRDLPHPNNPRVRVSPVGLIRLTVSDRRSAAMTSGLTV